MKPVTLIGGGAAVLTVLLSSATFGGAPAASVTGPTHSVIVLMKNKLSGGEALSDQAPVMGRLTRGGSRHFKQFQTVNSLSTTATDAEIEQLKADPSVAAVVPDVVIRHATQKSASTGTSASTSLVPHVIPGACGANGKVLLDPEALQTTNTNSDDPAAKTARSLGFTGAGVVVAYVADGIDPNNVNFIRKNGKSAFIDYQDFSGDGPGVPTSGDEAFLDANSIAGQGLVKYNVANFAAQPDPSACNIRIEGMAPGASLMGLKVFAENTATTESNFLEAIDYAIQHHVDVLNESFGSNPFPDVTALDITKLFNEEAVKAGITVVVSSGDSGYTNTIGSPATDPNVIAVGGSTTFRFYAQTNYAAARYFATTGWLNDNISSLSSSGFSESGSTIDVVAPGDLGFASCDANPLFYDCTNLTGAPSTVEESGGTSQSAPLTAGAAALVIEAYRNSHHGHSPSPAVVKQILTSTATDLGVPAAEQGSGLVNSYKAVLLAQSIGNSPRNAVGQTLLLSQSQLNGVGAPGTNQSWPVTVTNTGNQTQIVKLSGRTFGPYQNVQKGNVVLRDGVSPQFANYQGLQNNYATFKFTVPAGQDRLFAQLAYATDPGAGLNGRVRMILVDPKGRLAAHSLPQGIGDYGSAEVRQPVAGTWLGVIFGDVMSIGGTNTTIPWQISTQRFVSFGSVYPNALALAPGQSGTIRVSAQTPWTPGDSSGSVVLTSTGGGVDPFIGAESNSIPVTLRSTIDVAHGGKFTGTLTGGNGRGAEGQIQFYQFNVGRGHQSITANVSLTNDPTNQIGAYLIAPDGTAAGFGLNSFGSVDTSTKNLTAFTLNPRPGLWTLIVDVSGAVVGNEISQPFSGNVALDDTGIKVVGIPPNSGEGIKAGSSAVVQIQVTNHTISPQAIFLDPRLNSMTTYKLANLNPPSGGAYVLPINFDEGEPEWLVPTQTSSVKVTAGATLPIMFDYGPFQGDPDLLGRSNGDGTAQGSFAPTGGTVQPGGWFALPSEIGPYKGAAPAGSVSMSMLATTKAFDTSVTSPGGDFWLASVDASVGDTFRAIPLQPGQSVTIPVTITPQGRPGTKVSGTLYIDALENGVPPYGEPTGDEIAAFPYSYTIE